MAVLELRGKHFTLYLEGDHKSITSSLFPELQTGSGYYYAGQGSISSPHGIERFLFSTVPTERPGPFDSADILAPASFDCLCGRSLEAVLALISQNAADLIDRVCETKLQNIEDWKERHAASGRPEHERLIAEIVFAPLSRDFLTRHLFGKTPLLFAV